MADLTPHPDSPLQPESVTPAAVFAPNLEDATYVAMATQVADTIVEEAMLEATKEATANVKVVTWLISLVPFSRKTL